MTALMYAVRYGSVLMIKELITNGADVNTANKEGKPVFDLTTNDNILENLGEGNSKAPSTLYLNMAYLQLIKTVASQLQNPPLN